MRLLTLFYKMERQILIDPLDLAYIIVHIMIVIFKNTNPTIKDVKIVCISLYGSPNVDFKGNVYILKFPNKKKYCGQTINLDSRMSCYRSNKQHTQLLTNAIKKHTFQSLIIDHIDIPLCLMDPLEIFFIDFYDLTNKKNGYNGTTGGNRGYTNSETTRKLKSIAMMGNKNPLGTKRSAETIAKYMAGEKNTMYGRRGKLAPGSKRTIAFGNIYECANNADKMLAEKMNLNPPFIAAWIKKKRYTNDVFYITDEFYECAIANKVEHITKDYYEYIIYNDITYFTNETYTVWSVFEKFCIPTEIPLREPKPLGIHHTSKPVMAFGIPYRCGQIAADALRETYKQKSKNFIVEWISHGRYPNDVFKISMDFYEYVVDNNITNITKQMYEDYM